MLAASGVPLPAASGPQTPYSKLLLKPLFSFAGKGIQFSPTQADLEGIPSERRADYLLQQCMSFVSTIVMSGGQTEAEFRILYMWPDVGSLTPALSGAPGTGKNHRRGPPQGSGVGGRLVAFYPADGKRV